MFVVEFLNGTKSDCDNAAIRRKWSMYVYGICFTVADNIYSFDRISVTEQHSAADDFMSDGDDENARAALQHRIEGVSKVSMQTSGTTEDGGRSAFYGW
jgi:hypothetical protein